ncbi:molybdenum cofactor biosynthesis protein MoaE [Erythrobacter sp. KMU-140]|uniref:Molybdopterin synthase catalytic subunit n=2 Tax=Erythrobacter rubeus TaxID=2760803 RepID=A0ABR8KVL6_9SPHN|nr:molybdenum cofactor biosynthesis protein MoaE [Erythrobacter rubeus]
MTKGGAASFTGYVSSNDGVEALELSHYEPLTLTGMKKLAIAARERFDLKAITIVHRVGRMTPGDPIVCVAAASRHRRDAINAVDFCMDHLKSAAWFWKRELKHGEWHWIEPRQADHEDLARWNPE